MTQHMVAPAPAALDEVQQGWHELTSRVSRVESENAALETENKALRLQLEKVIAHRQQSHSELVMLLTTLISKLPINEVGALVSRLVEHNNNVCQFLGALGKGAADTHLPEPAVLKTMDQAKRELLAALKPVVEELLRLDTPFETDMLQSLTTDPELFFSPRMARARRCFVKAQVPRERIVRDFGEAALALCNDMTTDPKLNPRPKPEEIMLAFRSDFETLLPQAAALSPEKKPDLLALYQRVQASKGSGDRARAQKIAFQKLSFVIELLHYYEHQNTEPADVIFAQRLPALVEQLVVTGPQDPLDEKLIAIAEGLLGLVVNPDHRQMVVNNVGKGGGAAKALKFVLRLRQEKVLDADHLVPEFVKFLVPAPPEKTPPMEQLIPMLRLIHPGMQRFVVKTIMLSERIRKEDAETLGKALGERLGIKGIEEAVKAQEAIPPEMERQLAWDKVKELIVRRKDPTEIGNAIRDRLHAKYDADEMRQSWITLTEADPMTLIRIFCLLPYRSDGKTDPIARTVMETYVTRLTHPKYAATHQKLVNSLKTMFRAKPDSPTLLNFMALIRWVDPEAANKLCADVGMPVPA